MKNKLFWAEYVKKFYKSLYFHLFQEMMATLEEYLEDREFLRNCLAPTVTSTNCDSARSNQQECLLRLLLNLPDLQPKLLKLLLEKLAEISLYDGSPPPQAARRSTFQDKSFQLSGKQSSSSLVQGYDRALSRIFL